MMRALLVIVSLTFVACSGALAGRWEGDREAICGIGSTDRAEFTIDDDLHGEGDVCGCDFSFDAEQRDGDKYRLDIDFDGACGFRADGKYDCDLERDGERVDCGNLGDYDFVGD